MMTLIALVALILAVIMITVVLTILLSSPRRLHHFQHTEFHQPHSHSAGWGLVGVVAFLVGILGMMIVGWLLSYQSNQLRQAEEHQMAQKQATQMEFEKQSMHQALEKSLGLTPLPQDDLEKPLEAPREENASQIDITEPASDPMPPENSEAESHSTTTPAVQFQLDTASLAMVILIITVVVLFMGGLWITHLCKHWTRDTFHAAGANAAWILPMLAIVGWIGYLYSPWLSLEPLSRNASYDPSNTKFLRYHGDTLSDLSAPFRVSTPDMSTWITNGQTTHGNKVLVPVHGGWLESEQEARNFARREAMRVLREDFEALYSDAQSWRIEFDLDQIDAIRKIETESRPISILPGQTKQMYRTHLQVELSDAIRSRIIDRWAPELRNFRTTLLQVFMVVLMVLFFAIGGCLSIDMRTHGAYTRRLRLASCLIVVAAGWGAFLMRESLIFRYLV